MTSAADLYPDIDAHVVAIMDLLKADTDLVDIVFDGSANKPGSVRQPPYVVVGSDGGVRKRMRFTGGQWSAVFTFPIQCVGNTASSLRAVRQAVYGQLIGVQPAITGRACHKITAERSVPGAPDVDLPDFWYGLDEFDLISDPAV